jgi:hypothetical protein
VPTLGAALIILAGMGEEQPRLAVGRLLAVRPLSYIGDRSYAFYLWHWPALVIADLYAGRQLSVAAKLLILAGAFGLSIISYRFFEDPIRRGNPLAARPRAAIRRRLQPYGYGLTRRGSEPSALRGLQVWPAATLAVLVAASLALSALDGREARSQAAIPATPGFTPPDQAKATASGHAGAAAAATTVGQPLPAVVAAVKAARHGAPLPSGLTPPAGSLLDPQVAYSFPGGCVPTSDSQTTSQVCRLGDTGGTRSMVVMGDSHAQMWMPAILSLAQRDGWVVRPIVNPDRA